MTLRALLRLAWREGRASRRRLLLLVAAIATGTAALVAINTFTANLRTAVSGEARSLLGAHVQARVLPAQQQQRLAPAVATQARRAGDDGEERGQAPVGDVDLGAVDLQAVAR